MLLAGLLPRGLRQRGTSSAAAAMTIFVFMTCLLLGGASPAPRRARSMTIDAQVIAER
jgi:hypothetical protein